MRMIVVLLMGVLAMTDVGVVNSAPNPKDHIDFWRQNYTVLGPESSPRVARAYQVFDRVLRAAGSRRGVVPRLLVIKENDLRVMAIPDGGVILSTGALDRCYQGSEHGDDRLAFVLGHEIAHQLKDDFWHMKFFQAVDDAHSQGKSDQSSVKAAAKIAKLTDQVQAKELEADEHGIIYAAMAGYNPAAIVTEDDKVNFFAEWVAALDPARLPGAPADPTHPSPAVRAAAVKVRLKQVLDELDIFKLGVLFYESGQYRRAVAAFREFLTYFPSREVYLDLAVSHHQLALEYYTRWKGEDVLPFRLSLTADPQSRAATVTIRGAGGGEDPQQLFHEHLDRAIELYRTAIAQDKGYLPAYADLASALILNDDAYEAAGLLQRALKQSKGQAPDLLTNLGVAYYYTDNPTKAKASFRRALQSQPDYPLALFNLARLAVLQKKVDEAKRDWRSYLKYDPVGPWAGIARAQLGLKRSGSMEKTARHATAEETLGGVGLGVYDDEVPKDWGKPHTRDILLGEDPYHLSKYGNGITTVSQNGMILLLTTRAGYAGKSGAGVTVGSSRQVVLGAYGEPTKILHLTEGNVWLYGDSHLAFRLRNGQTVSWTLYGR